MNIQPLIDAFENHTKALLEHAKALLHHAASNGGEKAPSTRGRKAVGEVNGVAQTPEQLAAAVASAQPATAGVTASAGAPATAATQQTTVSELPPVVVQITLQQVADAIIGLANSADGGRDKAVSILTQFGVKKVPELKAEQYAAVLEAVKAKAAAPVSASAGLV